MEITKEDMESMKNAWLTYEEIQSIIEAEKDIENWRVYTHEYVKKVARQKLYDKCKANV